MFNLLITTNGMIVLSEKISYLKYWLYTYFLCMLYFINKYLYAENMQ